MHVKKAPVHVDDLSMSNKHHIRFARKVALVKSIPITQPMNNRSNNHLRVGVAASNTRHVEAALIRR
jgi:hypothetical protein